MRQPDNWRARCSSPRGRVGPGTGRGEYAAGPVHSRKRLRQGLGQPHSDHSADRRGLSTDCRGGGKPERRAGHDRSRVLLVERSRRLRLCPSLSQGDAKALRQIGDGLPHGFLRGNSLGKLALESQARIFELLPESEVLEGQYRPRPGDSPPSACDGRPAVLRKTAKPGAGTAVFPGRPPERLGSSDSDSAGHFIAGFVPS